MKGLKHILQEYKKKGIGSDHNHIKMIDLIDEVLILPLKEKDEEAYFDLMKDIHEIYIGEHFDENFAKYEVSEMFHEDEKGGEHKGAIWSMEQTNAILSKIKSQIKCQYNEYDWYVLLHAIYHDNCDLLKKWFVSEDNEQRTERYVEMAINWLNDPDYCEAKVWKYFSAMHENKDSKTK